MHGTYTTQLRFHVREVSLHQLASLWSAVMACLPEVRNCSATFERRGQFTEHTYVYHDADELARADLDVKPGELHLSGINVRSRDTTVDIGERFHVGPSDLLLAQPKWLAVEISGSNERDVVKLRAAIGRWGGRNLETSRLWLWLKGGVLATGIGVAVVIGVIRDLPAADTITAALFWFAVFKCAEAFQGLIPALRHRTLELRIVNGAQGGGSGRGGYAPVEPEPDPDARARPDIDTRAARENA